MVNRESFPARLAAPLVLASLLSVEACSSVGPGLAHHPIDCKVGYAWSDCLPGTPGYQNYLEGYRVGQQVPALAGLGHAQAYRRRWQRPRPQTHNF
jgi:hypothetical protein